MPKAADWNIGDELPVMKTEPLTRHALALYCGASGDHNPIHVDYDYAKEAGLDDVIAHGMLSMGYLGKMLTNWIPQRQLRSYQARFTAITHIGETVYCSGRIAKKWEEDGRWLVKIELSADTLKAQTIIGEAEVFLD